MQTKHADHSVYMCKMYKMKSDQHIYCLRLEKNDIWFVCLKFLCI